VLQVIINQESEIFWSCPDPVSTALGDDDENFEESKTVFKSLMEKLEKLAERDE
jgi:hypothetical protein